MMPILYILYIDIHLIKPIHITNDAYTGLVCFSFANKLDVVFLGFAGPVNTRLFSLFDWKKL